MAEEEVLVETAAPSKKEKGGGGFSIIHLAIIAVLLIGVTAVGTMMLSSKLGKSTEELTKEIARGQKIASGSGPLRELQKLSPCDEESKGQIVDLASLDKPMIVTLSDGESYLSITISLCIPSDMAPEDFNKQKALVFHVANEYLGTFSKADFFPGGAAKSQTVPEGSEGDLASEFGDEAPTFTKKKDEVRAGLRAAMAERNIDFIKDVYFTSFLIQ